MRYSVSTFSINGLLQSMPLLDAFTEISRHGINTVEICHFHLNSMDPGYLSEVKAAAQNAGVEIYSILADRGDIVSPDTSVREEDVAFARSCIEAASRIGAKRVRVDAGLQPPTPDVVELSAHTLASLADYAGSIGTGVITENWHATSRLPGPLLEILDRCEGAVGLCADTGNAEGEDKYETLERLIPRATSMHFKARYRDDDSVEPDDIARCTAIMKGSGFSGPISLIYPPMEHEWEGILALKAALAPTVKA
jgi:sugar phosphate isomerase/epimerase